MSRVYELQNKSFDFPEDILTQARSNIHAMIEELILGQMIDVNTMTGEELSPEHLEKKTLYKSAKYSFSRPMTTGAILAKVSTEQQENIEKLGIQMGLAFQVRDDLMDLVAHDTSKSIFSDIQEGQQTVFTQYIYQQGKKEDKKLLRSCMGKILTKEQIIQLQNMLYKSGAIDYGKTLIKTYGDQATKLLNQIKFQDPNIHQDLAQLIEKIVKIKL
ncbi:MAG: hypothetical protein GXP45_07165 [bacterium]|nr:hypothetical protein [bacterium]